MKEKVSIIIQIKKNKYVFNEIIVLSRSNFNIKMVRHNMTNIIYSVYMQFNFGRCFSWIDRFDRKFEKDKSI